MSLSEGAATSCGIVRPYRSERTPLFPCERGETALVRLRSGQGRRHLHACRGVSRSGDFMEQVKFIAETANMPIVPM